MNLVIVTGSPNSGWEIKRPFLQSTYSDREVCDESSLIDDCYREVGAVKTLSMSNTLQPDEEIGDLLASLLSKSTSEHILVVDSRRYWLLDFLAEKFPQARFILFFNSAESALEYAMEQGCEHHRFLAEWLEGNKTLLKFYRHHRQNALLFDAGMANNHPSAFSSVCKQHGIEVRAKVTEKGDIDTQFNLRKYLAVQFISSQVEIRKMQMELEASSQPLGGGHPEWQFKSDDLIQAYFQFHSDNRKIQQRFLEMQESLEETESIRKKLLHANELIEAEKQNLAAQLADAWGGLKKQEALQHEMTKDNEQQMLQKRLLQEELNSAMTAMNHAEAVQVETMRENELLMTQLHQVQEELEHYYFKYQDLKEIQQQNSFPKNEGAENNSRKAGMGKLLLKNFAAPFLRNKSKITRKDQKRFQKEVNLVKASGLFDEKWYLAMYADVAEAGKDPVSHYILYGAAEGRHPSPEFDTQAYLQANPDVAAEKINPLVHYAKFGRSEGRIIRKPELN